MVCICIQYFSTYLKYVRYIHSNDCLYAYVCPAVRTHVCHIYHILDILTEYFIHLCTHAHTREHMRPQTHSRARTHTHTHTHTHSLLTRTQVDEVVWWTYEKEKISRALSLALGFRVRTAPCAHVILRLAGGKGCLLTSKETHRGCLRQLSFVSYSVLLCLVLHR